MIISLVRAGPAARSMPLIARSAFVRLLLLSGAASLSGCGAYLHRPELQTATADIKTKVSQLAAPAYLAAQQQALAAFATDEDRALAEYLVASRDYTLLNAIRGPNGEASSADSAAALQGNISQHLQTSIGKGVLEKEESRRFQTERFFRNDAVRDLTQMTGAIPAFVSLYRQAKGTASSLKCVDVRRQPKPPSADPQAAQQAYANLYMVCTDVAAQIASAEGCGMKGASGRLSDVCAARAALASDAALGSHLEQLKKAESALRKAYSRPRRTEFQQNLDSVEGILNRPAELVSDEDYREVLEALDDVLTADLGEALDQLAASAAEPAGIPLNEITAEALHLLGAIADWQAAKGTAALDQPSALLIGLAKVRHELNMVKLELAHRERLRTLYDAQAAAIRTQVHYLARAQAKLCYGRQPCSPNEDVRAQALSHYVSSYNHGSIPFEVLRFREIQLERDLAVERAKASEADYRALIQPAIDQLAAYGDGGLKPEMLAPIISNLPVAGAILGR